MAGLVKQLDKVVAENSEQKLAAVVNFLGLDEEQVTKFAETHEIKHVALVVTDQKNADRFNVSEDADLTVMHYKAKEVKANHAVAKGKLDEKTAKAIIESTSTILDPRADETADLKSGVQVGDKVVSYQSVKAGGADDGVEVGESLCYT